MHFMKTIRLLIADDHMLMRMGLVSFIAGKKDLKCVGEADNGRTAVALARKFRPDVIIMDLMMPEMSGAEATKLIHAELPDVKIIILTSYGTSREMSEAISNGASGALMKDASAAELVEVVRKVAAGKTVIPSDLMAAARGDAEMTLLTDHQKELLASVAAGRTNADIAKEFGISENTVKKIVSTIFVKIGATSRAEATSIALRKHLLKT